MSGTDRRTGRSALASRAALGGGVVVVALLAALPFIVGGGTLSTMVSFLSYLALAQMWNLLAGYAGLLSVGQQVYVGIGAYSLFVLADKAHLHPFAAVPLAGVVALVLAVPIAALVFRLRGGYFAIGTWVVAEVAALLVINTKWLKGGTGVTITSASKIGAGFRLDMTYWIALLVAVLSVTVVYLLLRSRLGLALTAVRDNEVGAQSLGVDVFRAKLWVYLLAALMTGIIGAVIYLNLLRVQPGAAFSIGWTAAVIFIVIIGGVGTIEGPIVGAIVYFLLQETLADYGSWYLIILGTVAVIVTLRARRGVWGLVNRLRPIELFPVQRRLEIHGDAEAAGTTAGEG